MSTHEFDAAAPLDLVPLPGSERAPAPGVASASAALFSDAPITITIVLRRRGELDAATLSGPPLTSEELAARSGASPDDLALVTSTLESLGLTIDSASAATRSVRVSGSTTRLSQVFGTSLESVTSESAGGVVAHRHRTGGLSVPRVLDGIITAVLGLDDRPQARAQFHVAPAAAASVSYTPLQLGDIYRFPAGTDGTGQSIAIIELGGGYAASDLTAYFGGLGIPVPSISSVGVDGGANGGGTDPSGADGEVLLDIEVAGALSPKSTFVVYFAPNTDAGFLDAISAAAHASPAPASMSISWGQSEDQWTAQARNAFDSALADAAALGVTVTAAAGDNGSSDGAADGANHADFPASSPHALACGGTSLRASGTSVSSETVWNNGVGRGATGGGVSDVFALPSYQSGASVPPPASGRGGRGVPDVAGNADPQTGYEVLVDGSRAVYGGTSAVAPLWAALIARLVQSLGTPLGLVQPRLYAATSGFRDVTTGNNGAFSAGPGWDACTGLGVPDGEALLTALGQHQKKAWTLPANLKRLLQLPLYGTLGTVRPNNTAQVNPMWFEFDGTALRFTHTTKRAKFHNLAANASMSYCLIDPDSPYHYAELYGRLSQVIPDPTGAFYVHLGQRYGNANQKPPADAADRVILVMEIDGQRHQ